MRIILNNLKRGLKMKNYNDTLKNGYEVIAVHYGARGGIVLASNSRQYATWEFIDIDETFSGHYFSESQQDVNDPYGEAMKDYIERIAKIERIKL